MKKLIIVLFMFVLAINSFGQDCASQLQFKEGTCITTSSYNDKDKLMGFSKSTCVSVTSNGSDATANMKNESFDKDGKSQSTHEYSMTCQKGMVTLDLKMVMPSQQTGQYKDMEMKIEGDNLEFPASLSVGQQLKDAKAMITLSSPAMPMTMNMDFLITNRKVEAKETINTASGSYECYKISYDTESITKVMGMNSGMKGKATVWYNTEVGMVKTMSYDKDGKSMGYTLITDIKK